ncbi:hypothetical protein FH972_001487 [Carpinus fangiana]|uniref:Dof zinc finger protein n=1 Tax=Carpinus fangiana TaxID=176857 RepID=A0A5N6QC20_9ROSI|nr:hypothetical protein FH972_001487 [Carpinus fangiana]
MVFSSLPVYLDPPNWQQQQQNYQQPPGGHGSENPQLPPPPPPPTGGPGSIRPGSMADRARQAKIPQPEATLKCPRCESTNTKFCYFNNYSLTQPRHFCKTCRRYWTRGGALRNVPVGGGCRRNKRSKSSSRSKSPATAEISTSTVSSSGCAATHDMLGHLPPPPPNLSFLPPLHHLTDYASGDLGLNFGGYPPPGAATGGDVQYQIGASSSGGRSFLSTGFAEQWRLQQVQQVQQFPFLANLEAPIGLFQYDQGGNVEPPPPSYLRSKPLDSEISVKMEDNQGLNLSRSHLGTSGNDQYSWGGGNGNAWTDNISGFTSSTTHML